MTDQALFQPCVKQRRDEGAQSPSEAILLRQKEQKQRLKCDTERSTSRPATKDSVQTITRLQEEERRRLPASDCVSVVCEAREVREQVLRHAPVEL